MGIASTADSHSIVDCVITRTISAEKRAQVACLTCSGGNLTQGPKDKQPDVVSFVPKNFNMSFHVSFL